LGVQGQYWHLMSADYALTLAAGASWFGETDKSGNVTPVVTDKYTQTSFHARVGGDRVVSVGDRALLYFGPGFEFWRGKAKFERSTLGSSESAQTSRYSLSGRIGAIMTIGPGWGLSFQIGRKVGYASATDAGAKATWWPSSTDAAGGITFLFGGAH
jgi:hypothetical protein